MCGIVAYLGKKNNVKNLIKILKKLEYRGYDSAGFSSFEKGEFVCHKKAGNIQNLENSISDAMETTCFIAHTRWATHGEANEVNAHPHISVKGTWSVVHNGIIENHAEIREKLKNEPQSETDTAVVPCLFEELNVQSFRKFVEVCLCLSGSFALACQNKSNENELFLAKRKSPLYLAQNDAQDIIVASDPICFVGFAKDYYVFEDDEFAKVSRDGFMFFNAKCEMVSKTPTKLDDVFEDSTKDSYEHFMLKEIFEQPKALERQLKTYKDTDALSRFNKTFIERFNQIKLIGCGTAYHAALVGAKYISKLSGVFSTAEMASEFVYNKPVFADSKTLFIFVSQSGETADTLQAVEIAERSNATTIALTNVLYSSLASKCDYVLPVCAGPEIAVASTKAYVCQLSALFMFANHLKCELNGLKKDYFEKINFVANNILNFNQNQIKNIAEKIIQKNDAIFIGKNLDYISSLEASLKLKEVAYVPSASYPSGELKHGFLALVEKGTPLIVLAGNKQTNQKTFNAMNEAVSRGAFAVVVTNAKDKISGEVIHIEAEDDMIFSMLSIAPLQFLAYQASIIKNINPDQPRNLAKSVTVEWKNSQKS